MPTCTELSQQMQDLTKKIMIYESQMIAAQNAHDQQKYDDASAGYTIASNELAALQAQYKAQGCQILPPQPPIPVVRILVVLDGNASFGPTGAFGDFGLSTVIRTLTTPMKGLIFQVTRAHRQTDPQDYSDPQKFPPEDVTIFSTNYWNFKFDEFDGEGGLEASFDEIWMFGVLTDDPTLPMSPNELKAIAKFMDAGGGVFATGDHQDMGLSMCGQVLRVRNMRKWYFNSPPPGFQIAPSELGTDRHDTLQSTDGNATFHFDNQSDDTPQPLHLILYGGLPHPLMSGPFGPINKFPDHMHEGEVLAPTITDDVPTFGDIPTPFVEYPSKIMIIKGHPVEYQPLPEVVAKGTVIGGHTTQADEAGHPSTMIQTSGTYDFGVVAAYDGHQVNVGRVSVDSTWHHFFDINLIGDPTAASAGRPAETLGFRTAAGKPILDGMRAYYRNIVMWLAPAKLKLPMLSSILFYLRFRQPLNETLAPRDYSAAEVLRIGEVARGALSSVVGESMAIDLVHGWLNGIAEPSTVASTPFHAGAQDLAIARSRLTAAALGGAVIALGRSFPRPRAAERSELERIVTGGLRQGLSALTADLRHQARALGELAEKLGAVADAPQGKDSRVS
jgi:hypothetical protein